MTYSAKTLEGFNYDKSKDKYEQVKYRSNVTTIAAGELLLPFFTWGTEGIDNLVCAVKFLYLNSVVLHNKDEKLVKVDKSKKNILCR